MRDAFAHVAVLLGGAGGVELLELDVVVDDRLQQVERPHGVRHHRLVRAVPGLADVRLCTEMEHVRSVRGGHQMVAHAMVDRGLVGQVREDDRQLVPTMADVVERPRRGRADECDDMSAEGDERLGQVRAHESIGTRDEAGSIAIRRLEVVPELRCRAFVPSLI